MYPPFDDTTPDGSTQTLTQMGQSTRDNLAAMRDYLATFGAMPGWNMSQSGGTAWEPAIIYLKRGAEWIKVVQTWGTTGGEAGNVTKEAYYYSANSGGAWDAMADGDGKYVLTYTYDAGSNCTATNWGSTP